MVAVAVPLILIQSNTKLNSKLVEINIFLHSLNVL